MGDGLTAPANINPGQINPGRVFFDAGLQINNQNKVAAQDKLNNMTPASNQRIWDATLSDSLTYVARAGLGQPFDAVFGFASINATSAAAGGLSGLQRLLLGSTKH